MKSEIAAIRLNYSKKVLLETDAEDNPVKQFDKWWQESFKAQQLDTNPKACLVFFWKELERQVRVTGLVQKVTPEESNVYFQSRPEESRIGALTSPQSRVIESREWIDDQYEKNKKLFSGKTIKRPDYWGGYIVRPVIVEFWQGRPGRLHDRIQYTLQNNHEWKIERLAP